MTKQDFLNSLRSALANRLSASYVEENVRYYEDYINTQVRMGKSEEQVIEELGDPRLLARSIADACKREGVSGADESREYTQGRAYRQYENAQGNAYNENRGKVKTWRVSGWLIVFIVAFVLLMIVGLAFSILSFLAPILLPVLLIVLLVRVFRRT